MLLRVGIGLVFVSAGIAKVRDDRSFRAALGATVSVQQLRQLASLGVPTAELVVGALLVAGIAPGAAALAAAMMLLAFAVWAARVVRSGASVTCGCFGSGARPVSQFVVVRNLVLAAVATGVAVDAAAAGDFFALWPVPDLAVMGLIPAALTCLGVTLVYHEVAQVLGNAERLARDGWIDG